MSFFTESRIKSDLKNLRYFDNSVKIFEKASKYFKNQYELAKENQLLSDEEKTSLENCIQLIDSNRFIVEQMKLKEKYLLAISKLDTLTQAIIVDAFINNCTYIEISLKMYCSVETIKRKVKNGIKALVDILNKE